jgi:hypothetical protein
LASALRIYAIVLSSLVFVRATDPRELAIALVTQMRVPLYVAACWAGNDISPSSKESGEPHTFLRSENLCGR